MSASDNFCNGVIMAFITTNLILYLDHMKAMMTRICLHLNRSSLNIFFFFFFWPSVDHGVDEKCEVQYSFEKYLYIYFYRSSVIHVGFIKVCQAACSLCNNIVPQCFQFSCVIFMSLCFVVN